MENLSAESVSHRYIPSMTEVAAIESRPKILIVDDEDTLRRVLKTMLDGFGFVTCDAGDGVEAIARLDEDPDIRFVLCDLRMPRMDGMAFLDAIGGRGLRVVMMSAYGTTDTAVEALGRGAVDYISKPFRPNEIRVALERLVERDRLKAENARLRATVGATEQMLHCF